MRNKWNNSTLKLRQPNLYFDFYIHDEYLICTKITNSDEIPQSLLPFDIL